MSNNRLPSYTLSVFLFVISFVFQSYAQTIPSYLIEKQSSALNNHEHDIFCQAVIEKPTGSQIIRKPYNVLRYNLFMDWRNPLSTIESKQINRTYTGVNEVHIHIDSANVSGLVFDGVNLLIDSVLLNEQKVNFTPSTGTFTINLPVNPNIGDTLTVLIHYTYIGTEDKGFHAYTKGTLSKVNDKNNRPLVNPEGVVYTMSQPENARYWMPCNDAPHDKARASITVRVPRDENDSIPFSVSSNGILQSIVEGEDTLTGKKFADYVWADTTLIPTYLMVANASRFTMFRQWYKKVSNPNDSIPIDNYVWAIDMKADSVDSAETNALKTFGDAPSMLSIYSRLFGEYPFSKYGHTVVAPYDYGGMEHQTMTTANRSWARKWSAVGISHEIVHQWLGDLVTCATWKDIWMNEGGATWGEALWYESWGGMEWAHKHLNLRRSQYLDQSPSPPIWGIPISNIFNYATTYCKAGWVYHMMRKVAGDEKFFPSLRSWFNKKRFQSAETEDFYNHLQEEIPLETVTWRQFFDQWLYSAGHPQYKATGKSIKSINDTYITTITIDQLQSGENVPEVFIMPLTLELRAVRSAFLPPIRTTIFNNVRTQTFTIETPFPVADIVVDPDSLILSVRENFLTSVEESEIKPESITATPNPVSDNIHVAFTCKQTNMYGLRIIDIEGREIMSVHKGILSEGTYSFPVDVRHLSIGTYRVIIENGIKVQSIPFVVYH